MKTLAIINIGILLDAIRRRGWTGFSEAAEHCRTSPKNFAKLASGELPRLDSLQRICRGLGISERELIVGMRQKPAEPATKVVEIKKVV